MQIVEHVLSSWDDIHQFSKHGWLYCGQDHSAWTLRTSLERCLQRENFRSLPAAEIETSLIREFRRAFHQFAGHLPEAAATMEWLALMQHHGAPTRLLDFTYSIYVASYFAVESADDDSVVWGVNGPWAQKRSTELFLASGKEQQFVERLNEWPFYESRDEAIQKLFLDPPEVRLAYPLNPFRLNERIRTQKGVFLMPGAIEAPFMENLAALLEDQSEGNIIRLVIPKDLRREALRKLTEMNISRTSLFPGLDGFAQSLAFYNPVFDPVESP